MKPLVKLFLFLSYFILSIGCSFSQQYKPNNEPKNLSQYVIRNWNSDNGLASESINDILQSEDYYIWMASFGGIIRFDGITFKHFNKQENKNLSTNNILCLAEDNNKQIWAGTQMGVVLIQNNQVKTIEALSALATVSIEKILISKNNDVWIATRTNELFRYKDNELVNMTKRFRLPSRIFSALHESESGSIWLGSNKSEILKFRNEKFELLKNTPSLNGINDICELNDTLFLASGIGVYRLVQNEYTKIIQFGTEASTKIKIDKHHNLWSATAKGILKYSLKDQTISTLNETNGLPNNIVRDILLDDSNQLWAGTYRGGLVQLFNGEFSAFGINEGFDSNIITGITEYRPNFYVAGDESGKLYAIDKGKVSDFKIITPIPQTRLKNLFTDSKHRLWISTYEGLIRIDNKSEKLFNTENGFPDKSIRMVFEDSQAQIWVGTKDAGLVKIYDNDSYSTLNTTDGLLSNFILSITEDNQGQLIVNTINGINYIKNDKIVGKIRIEEGAPSNFSFRSWHDGQRLWVASNNGIWCNDNDSIHVIDMQNGLPFDSYFDILPDKSGNIWLPGEKGILKISLPELNKVIKSSSYKPEFELFGKGNGLRNNNCIGAVSSLIDSNSAFWIPTQGGIVYIKPDGTHQKIKTIEPYLENVLADNKVLTQQNQKFTIPAATNRINIEFTAFDYSNPHNIRFRYRLKPFETAWVETDNLRAAHYTSIWPGNYTFELQVSNSNKWKSDSTSIHIIVKPAWWQTWFFYSFLVLLISSTLFLIYRMRLRIIKRQQEQLEDIIQLRTAEVEAQKKVLEEQATSLQTANKEVLKKSQVLSLKNIDLQHSFAQIREQKYIIERSNEQTTNSIRYAQTIQKAILPSDDSLNQLFNHFVIFQPKDIVSGDIYWVSKPIKNSKDELVTFVAVVDCTGHGVPGGFMSMIAYQLLNVIVYEKKIRCAAGILYELDKQIRYILQQETSDNKDGMDIALCAVKIENPSTKQFQVEFAGAKRPLLVIDKHKNLQKIAGSRRSIGGYTHNSFDIDFEKHNLTLDSGSILLLSSDGYIHQPNKHRKSLGSNRFQELITQPSISSLDDMKVVLEKALIEHQGAEKQRDDIAILGIQLGN